MSKVNGGVRRKRQEKATEFDALPVGTVVMINGVNGCYVIGSDDLEAMDKFDQILGKGTTLAFSFTVGRPVFIGGGIA